MSLHGVGARLVQAVGRWTSNPVAGVQFPSIRDFPDHATLREKGAKLACADKLGVFFSLTLCNKANFDTLK